jgi:hypothetical protein
MHRKGSISQDLDLLKDLLEELTSLQTELDFVLDATPRLIDLSPEGLDRLRSKFVKSTGVTEDMLGTLEDLIEVVGRLRQNHH